MNASEARELTKKYIRDNTKNPITEIEESILNSIKCGMNETYYKFKIKHTYLRIKDCVRYFKMEGYGVELRQDDSDYGINYTLKLKW